MKSLLDSPSSPPSPTLCAAKLTATPGQIGDWRLASPAPEVQHFGFEDPPGNYGEWSDYGRLDTKDGHTRGFEYALHFRPGNGDSMEEFEQIHAALLESTRETLGKPTKKTKRQQTFVWDGGSMSIARDDSDGVQTIYVQHHGAFPENMTPRTADVAKATRPNADALRESLNDLAGDSFDCGMTVLEVQVSPDAPYAVDVTVSFQSKHAGQRECVFRVVVDDASFDLVSACVDEMGGLIS